MHRQGLKGLCRPANPSIEAMSERRYVITHGHIFKNAGTSFDWALRQHFGRAFIDHRDNAEMRRGGARYLLDYLLAHPHVQAFSSHHLCYPLPEHETLLCIPVYFLRDPIERVVSVYNFERMQPESTPGSREAKRRTLTEYVEWRLTPGVNRTIRSYQTAYLAGAHRFPPDQEVGPEHFERALANLRSSTTLIGLVERYDDSLRRIEQSLRSYLPSVCLRIGKQNVMNPKAAAEKQRDAHTLLAPVLEQLRESNRYDLALLEAARGLPRS